MILFIFLTRNGLICNNVWENYFINDGHKFDIVGCSDNITKDNLLYNYNNIQIYKTRELNLECRLTILQKFVDRYDYYMFLTEDSIPLKTLSELLDFIDKNNNKSFFNYNYDDHIKNGKYSYRYFDFDDKFRLKNNDWICLNNNHVNIILKNITLFEKFYYPFGGEHAFSTIFNYLNMLDDVYNFSMLYENWDGYNNHYPSIFTSNDVEKILSIKRNNNSFFLRKFKNDDLNLSKIINMI